MAEKNIENIKVKWKGFLMTLKGHYKFVQVQSKLLLSFFSQGWVFISSVTREVELFHEQINNAREVT